MDNVLAGDRDLDKGPSEETKYQEGTVNLGIGDYDDFDEDQSRGHSMSGHGPAHSYGSVPGIVSGDNTELVTSESNLGVLSGEEVNVQGLEKSPAKKDKVQEQVSQAFKSMIASNHKRHGVHHCNNCSKCIEEAAKASLQAANPKELAIEEKFKHKLGTRPHVKKKFLEDSHPTMFKESSFDLRSFPFLKKTKKKDVRKVQDFVLSKAYESIGQDLDPLTQKIEIQHGYIYKGTSQDDVFEFRRELQKMLQPLHANKFLKLNKLNLRNLRKDPEEEEEEEVQSPRPLKPPFKPYQLKVYFQVDEDSSALEDDEDVKASEAHIFQQEQPYVTATNHGFKEMLKQLPTQEIGRRSDMTVTSTLSLSLIPKDNREIIHHHRARLSYKQLQNYIDERNTFLAMKKEHFYRLGHVNQKTQAYNEIYMKSFLHRHRFKTMAM